jgi:hypothetical protein
MLQIEHSWFSDSDNKAPKKQSKTLPDPIVRPSKKKQNSSALWLVIGFLAGSFIFVANYYVSPTQAAGNRTLSTAVDDFSRNLNAMIR